MKVIQDKGTMEAHCKYVNPKCPNNLLLSYIKGRKEGRKEGEFKKK
jgi:hypothetical protein